MYSQVQQQLISNNGEQSKNKISVLKGITGVGLLIITSYAAMVGNETIFPSALIVFLLFLFSLRKKGAADSANPRDDIITGNAARFAIATYAIFMAVLSVVISLFLPAFAAYFHLTGLFDGDFVRVTINDAHEFAYSTCLLLLLNAIFYVVFFSRRKQV
jgi:hypothetical protein